MADSILDILDICVARLKQGETVERCLADYPEHREELRPLLTTASSLRSVRRVSLTPAESQAMEKHLFARIQAEAVKKPEGARAFDLSRTLRNPFARILVPAAMVVVVALIVWLALPVFHQTPISPGELTLSIIQGNAEIMASGAQVWSPAKDRMDLSAGSKVRTSAGSVVLLTFFDSSTTRLDPATEVLVKESAYIDKRAVRILLEQASGRTWNYVLGGGETPAYFAVQTPQLKAVAMGTAFTLTVDPAGYTGVVVSAGVVQIDDGLQKLSLMADQQFKAGAGISAAAPQPAAAAASELVVSTGLPGVGSVVDPSGASTGLLPDGLAFNQIAGSKSVLSSTGQQITIINPEQGEYLVAVRPVSRQAVPFAIQAKRNGKVVSEYTDTLSNPGRNGWLIRLKVDKTSGAVLNAAVISIDDLADQGPEKVVETELAKQRITPVATIVPVPSTPPQVSTPAATTGPAVIPAETATPSLTPAPASAPAPSTAGVTPEPVVTPAPTPAVISTPVTTSTPTTVITPTPALTATATPTPTATPATNATADTPSTSSGGNNTPANVSPSVKPTIAPTKTASPTKTPVPSSTPVPSNKPAPTKTPAQTSTPAPTKKPAPSAAPAPDRDSSPERSLKQAAGAGGSTSEAEIEPGLRWEDSLEKAPQLPQLSYRV